MNGRRKTRLFLALAAVGIPLLAARVALPHFLESVINRQLESVGEYRGQVADVDVALFRGAYSLNELVLIKSGGKIGQPFVDMESLDLSIEWRALLHGSLAGEVLMENPVVNFVQGEERRDTQLGKNVNWPDEVRKLFPFDFNRVRVRNGLLTFRAPGIRSDQSLTLRDLEVEVQNLKNVRDRDLSDFATLRLAGSVMDAAPLRLEGTIDPNEVLPTFDVNITLENARLPQVNPWLREYLHVDAEAGTFAMYSELATAEGRFRGYVKPILEDARIFELGEETKTPFHALWELLVQFAAKIFENPPEDQVATEIPLSGSLDNPDADLLATFVGLARNAFVTALSHSIDDSITLAQLRPESFTSPQDER